MYQIFGFLYCRNAYTLTNNRIHLKWKTKYSCQIYNKYIIHTSKKRLWKIRTSSLWKRNTEQIHAGIFVYLLHSTEWKIYRTERKSRNVRHKSIANFITKLKMWYIVVTWGKLIFLIRFFIPTVLWIQVIYHWYYSD